jgi:hypothetical protein
MCKPMFIAVLLTIAKLWNMLRCPTTDEWIKKILYIYIYHIIYIPWNITQPHKEKWNSVICRKMDGTGDHYAKWNSYTFSFILHLLLGIPRKTNSVTCQRLPCRQIVWADLS